MRSRSWSWTASSYLAAKAADTEATASRRAELEQLSNVVIPGLVAQQDRLVDAIASGMVLDAVRDRLKKVTAEREQAEAKREELEAWQRDETSDRERAEELRARWAEWSVALEDDPILARQVLFKALAGAPIFVQPSHEPRTWVFLGLASFEGVLRGAVRPGGIATFIDDEAPHVERGAAPMVVREALAALAGMPAGPLPMVREADGTSRVDWAAARGVPSWARSVKLKLPIIAGGSDAPLGFNESGSADMAPHTPIARPAPAEP